MADPSAASPVDVGKAVQRIVGSQPTRRRRRGANDPLSLTIASHTPEAVATLLRSPNSLLLACPAGEAGALVLAVCAVDPVDQASATLSAWRLYAGCIALSALVRVAFEIELNLVMASGDGGLHAFSVGSRLGAAERELVTRVLPDSAERRGLLQHEWPKYTAFIEEVVDACFAALQTQLSAEGFAEAGGGDWGECMRLGGKGGDSPERKQARINAVLPLVLPREATLEGVAPVPLAAVNADGYLHRSKPLPLPKLDGKGALHAQLPPAWTQPLTCLANSAVTVDEVAILDAVVLSTFHCAPDTTAAKAVAKAAELERRRVWKERATPWPRFAERRVPLHAQDVDQMLPGILRELAHRSQVHREVNEHLYNGCERGGLWPSKWVAEPASKRPAVANKAPWAGVPLLICIIAGMPLDAAALELYHARLVRAVVATDFPIDAAVAALALTLSDGRNRILTYFEGVSTGVNATHLQDRAWSYSAGTYTLNIMQSATRKRQALKAAQWLATVRSKPLRKEVSRLSLAGSSSSGTQSDASSTSTRVAAAVGGKRRAGDDRVAAFLPEKRKRELAVRPATPPPQWELPPVDTMRAAPGDGRTFEERMSSMTHGQKWTKEAIFLYDLCQHNKSRTLPVQGCPGNVLEKDGTWRPKKNPKDSHAASGYNNWDECVYDRKCAAEMQEWKGNMAKKVAECDGASEPYKLNLLLDDIVVLDMDDEEAMQFFEENLNVGDFKHEFARAPLQKTRKGYHYLFLRPPGCTWVYMANSFGDIAPNKARSMDMITVTGSNRTRGNLAVWPSKNKMWIRSLHDWPLHRMSEGLAARVSELHTVCRKEFKDA